VKTSRTRLNRKYTTRRFACTTMSWLALLLVSAADAEGANKKVFIFAGQSNMAGADAAITGTGAQNLVDAGLQTDADRNARFTYGASFDPANVDSYAWGDVRGHVAKSVYVYGPEVGFERTLYANGLRDIAIIKVADNFSVPNAGPWPWTNKDPNGASPDFYNHWSAFINARLAELTSNGDTYTIAGFVWDQGIDDALNNATQAQYQANLTSLVALLRADYGTATTPFVLARSKSPMPSQTAMNAVRDAQVAVADADPHAVWIDTDDLPNVNIHHFSADSQLVIGEREAKAYLALRVPEPSSGWMLLTVGLAIGLAAVLAAWRRKRRVETNRTQPVGM
jgi:hypothetical protein